MLFCIYLSYIYLSYFELFKERAVTAYFASLDLSIYLLFNQKDKGTSNFYFYAVPLFFIFEVCK